MKQFMSQLQTDIRGESKVSKGGIGGDELVEEQSAEVLDS